MRPLSDLQPVRRPVRQYNSHVLNITDACMRSREAGVSIAQAGLDSLYSQMTFARDGATLNLADAMAKFTEPRFATGTVKGSAAPPAYQLVVPYGGAELSGESLTAQFEAWATYGSIEPSAAAAVCAVANDPAKYTACLADTVFVLLGATSAMGPMHALLDLGATVAPAVSPPSNGSL
jgi:hypothetical protein